MFDVVLERFSKEAPSAVLFRGLFSRVFSSEQVDRIFWEHKERQVQGQLLFSTMIRLLLQVVTGNKKSVNAAYMAMKDELGVSAQSLYNKLAGVELAVSEALVREPVKDLLLLVHKTGVAYEDPIAGYHAFILDGKRLDRTEHRLQETRTISNGPLPGTVIGMLDTRSRMFVDVALHEDGHACERKIVESMLDRLEEGKLYIQDRNFSDGPLIDRFLSAKALFITRQHGQSPKWRKAGALKKKGRDACDGTVVEQPVEVRLPDGSWAKLRRILIKLAKATRNGEKEIAILTNLPTKVSATQIANAYGHRWTIETCLGHLATALNAEINTLAYPRAALVSFAVALMSFNLITTLETLLRGKVKDKKKSPKLSKYYLACEIVETFRGLEIMSTDEDWRTIANLPLNEFYAWAKAVASGADLSRYTSTTRGEKKPPPKRRKVNNSTHISTHKILLEREK